MFFCKNITYENKNRILLDELFSKISNKTSYDIAYRTKKECNQIIMKPINNLIVYNSFKPVVRIFCTQDSITLNIYLKKTSIFALFFAIAFLIILDLMTIIMNLYSNPEWLLALLIAHVSISILTVCARLSLVYFYKKIDNWLKDTVLG